MLRSVLTLLSVLSFTVAGCSGLDDTLGHPDVGGDPGDWGVTPGGAQDIGYARDLIEEGGVPQASDIPIEGLLSEHDLPTVGEPCDSLICLRPALGIAPHLASASASRFVHIGMTSGLPSDFERPPLDVVVVVDKSSAMSIDMTETTEAMARLVDRMRPQDRIAVIAFDEAVTTIYPLSAVTDADALKATVRQIPPDGHGFDIDGATERAMSLLAASTEDSSRMQRVMILSCGYPALSDDGGDRFSTAVTAGAEAGIGTSFFGVLLGYSANVSDLLGSTRGGSSYYLQDLERTEQAFDEDFDGMVTPLAYELALGLDVGSDYVIDKIYGIPADDEGAPRTDVEIETAFLSKRRGGIVARLSTSPDSLRSGDVGAISLSYEPESALGFSGTFDDVQPVAGPSTDEDYFESSGVRIAAALVNQGERMREACTAFHAGDGGDAIEILEELHAYLEHEASELDHAGLADEAALVAKLKSNME